MTRRALIIGGSLGGMFAAHLLRLAGWRVDVFERSTEDLAGRGAGLGSHEALRQIMARIGIDTSAPQGVAIPRYVWLDKDGGVVADVPRPRMMTAWSRLYRPLKELLPAELYHPAKSLVRVEQDERSVTAIFADGTRETGDILVGADGARSAVRAQLAPEAKTEYAGYIAWRALIPEAEATEAQRELLYARNAFCIPDGELWVSYPVPARDGDITPGKRDYNIVWYRSADEAALADLNTDEKGVRHEQIPPPLIRRDVIEAVKQVARDEHRAVACGSVHRVAAVLPGDPRSRLAAARVRPRRHHGRCGVRGAPACRRGRDQGRARCRVSRRCAARQRQASRPRSRTTAATRKAAGDWIIDRSREFGATCIHGQTDPAGRMRRAGAHLARVPDDAGPHPRVGPARARGGVITSCPPSPHVSSSAA